MIKKGILVGIIAALAFTVSCKDEEEKETSQEVNRGTKVNDSVPKNAQASNVFYGEYIYTDSAAVLKGNDFIYGVKIDSTAKRLAEAIEPRKKNEHQMFPVVVKGDLSKNENEGWEEILTITKIITIREPKQDESIKISSNKPKTQ